MNSSLLNLLMFTSKKVCQIFMVQVLAVQLLTAGGLKSQSLKEIKIDFEVKNAPLAEVFQALESKTDFRFGYNLKVLKSNARITINEPSISVENILLRVADVVDLKFKRINDQILVLKDEGRRTDEPTIEVLPAIAVTV